MTLSMEPSLMVDTNVVSSLVTHNASDFEEITGLQIITECRKP
jgi:hypothetical protein